MLTTTHHTLCISALNWNNGKLKTYQHIQVGSAETSSLKLAPPSFQPKEIGNTAICSEVINTVFSWGLDDERGTVRFLLGTEHIRSNLQNQYQLLASKDWKIIEAIEWAHRWWLKTKKIQAWVRILMKQERGNSSLPFILIFLILICIIQQLVHLKKKCRQSSK